MRHAAGRVRIDARTLTAFLQFLGFVLFSLTGSSASAALAIDATVSRDQSTAAISTAPFSTTAANELLLAFIGTDYLSGPNTTVTGVSGGGLSWVLVRRTNAQSGTAEIWRAFAPSTLSNVTVTATLSQNVAASMTVMSFAGADTTGTNGSGAIGATGTANSARGAPKASLTTSRNGSWVVGVGNDFDNAISRTVGANQKLVHQDLSPTGDTYWVQMQGASTPASGTSVSINDTAPSSDRYNLSICEVLPASAVGQQTWSLSGTLSPSSAGAGATVTLTGAATGTVTADASGNYSFSNLSNGAYTVTPTRSGYSFTPTSQSVTIANANVSSVNFTGQPSPPSTWSISGTISPVSAGAGATVGLSGASTATVTADSSGNYTFSGLSNGAYTVTPTQSGYTFSPINQPVTINGANGTAVNFTGQASAPPTWSISGTISPSSVGAGATVGLSGGSTATVTANSSGNYSFSGLANGTYTITPTQTGFSFAPTSQSVTINGTNVTAVNFTGQSSSGSSPIQLIQKSVNGNESTVKNISATFPSNNTAGNLLIVTGTAARPHGTITVSDTAGNTYLPAIGPVTDLTQDVTAYIWYVPNCRGGANKVTLTPSTPDAMEIHISEFSGIATTSPVDQVASATGTGPTASSGASTTTVNGELVFGYTFLFNTASAGAGYTGLSLVNGDLDEYLVQSTAGSVAATFTQTSGTWFALMATFKPAGGSGPQTSSISGTISPSTIGSATTVTLSGPSNATVTADSSGNYSFSGLANGIYTVTPTQTGFSFAPTSQFVTVSGANVAAINFTGQPSSAPTWSISGTISPAAAGAGATVGLSGGATAAVTADSSGNYSFSGLANGPYTVTPSQSGYLFTPPSQSVTINGASVTAVSFTGQVSSPPPNPLAIDATTSKDGTTPSTTISTASFSTQSGNELVLAFVSTDYISGPNVTVTGLSGGGLNWVLVGRTNVQNGTSEIWRAFAPSALSGATVTATLSQKVVSSLTVMSFSGVDPSGTSGSGAIGATGTGNSNRGAPTASLTTTRNGSIVVGVGTDYDNAISRAPGANQHLVHQDLAPINDTYWVQAQNAPIPMSATAVTINDTAPTSDRYDLTICEILAGTGGGGTGTPPTVAMTAPATGVVTNLSTMWAVASDAKGVAGVQFLLDGSSLGSEVTSPPYTIIWDTRTVASGPHTLAARARNVSGLTTLSATVPVTVDNSGNSAVVGSWSSAVNIPAVAVNLVLLKNNKVLFYQDGSTPTVWDYTNSTFAAVPTTANLFCSGHALLADGRVLVVGGWGGGDSDGIANAEIFDPSNNSWTAVPNMSYQRWYPTATTLSDGTIMVTAGWQTGPHANAGIPEIYNASTNTWTKLTSANNPFETYPFLYQLSDGRVIHVGNSEYATVTDILDLTTQTWSVVDPNIVDGASCAMYLPGKIIKAGTASDSQGSGPSANTTYLLDTTAATPVWQQTPSMAYSRSFLNLPVLPDGTVLALGGETDKNGGNIANAVYQAERWSPQTQTWTTMAAMHTPREYHGTAILLPDARVLVSGMGADFGNVPNEMNAEFYSPPYLFQGPRPSITQAPAQISYGTNFFISTPDAATITTAVLIRTGAVTHFFDQNTRYLPLTFQQTTGGLTLSAPAGANFAPPGYYMLFIVNSSGIPSVAPFVQLQ